MQALKWAVQKPTNTTALTKLAKRAITMKCATLWKNPLALFIGSVAVLAKSAILSFDYEYVDVQSMRVCDDNGDEYLHHRQYQELYQGTAYFRFGAEYRLTPNWSIRAGYSMQKSPVVEEVVNNQMDVALATVILPTSSTTIFSTSPQVSAITIRASTMTWHTFTKSARAIQRILANGLRCWTSWT